MTPIDVLYPNFMPICPITKKNDLTVPVTKHPPFRLFTSGLRLRIVDEWSKLPQEVVNAPPSFNAFKNKLD